MHEHIWFFHKNGITSRAVDLLSVDFHQMNLQIIVAAEDFVTSSASNIICRPSMLYSDMFFEDVFVSCNELTMAAINLMVCIAFIWCSYHVSPCCRFSCHCFTLFWHSARSPWHIFNSFLSATFSSKTFSVKWKKTNFILQNKHWYSDIDKTHCHSDSCLHSRQMQIVNITWFKCFLRMEIWCKEVNLLGAFKSHGNNNHFILFF